MASLQLWDHTENAVFPKMVPATLGINLWSSKGMCHAGEEYPSSTSQGFSELKVCPEQQQQNRQTNKQTKINEHSKGFMQDIFRTLTKAKET